jgi:rubrerythrin
MDPRQGAGMFKWSIPNKGKHTPQQDSHIPSYRDRVPFADDNPLRSAASQPNKVLKRHDEVKEENKEPPKSRYASEGKRPTESLLAEIKQKLIIVASSPSAHRLEEVEQVQQLKQTLNSLWVLNKCPTCLTAGRSHAFTCGHLVCRSCAEDPSIEVFPSDSANGLLDQDGLRMQKGKSSLEQKQRKVCPVCSQISETYQVFY